MPQPTLLNDHVLLELPKDHFANYSDSLRTAVVASVPTAQGSAPPAVGDTVAFAADDARVLNTEDAIYLVVARARLRAITARSRQ